MFGYNTTTGAPEWYNGSGWVGVGAGGAVTGLSVATVNGFAGSFSSGATPALTLTIGVTGLAKGNGTALSAAVAGTDYLAPAGSGAALTGLTWSQIGTTPTTLAGYGITAVTGTGNPVLSISPTLLGTWIFPDATTWGPAGLTVTQGTAPFIVNANAAAGAMAPLGNAPIAYFSGVDTKNTKIMLDTYAGIAQFTGRRAAGTKAAPTALLANTELAQFGAAGYDGVSYDNVIYAEWSTATNENWSGTAHGTYVEALITENTTKTKINAMTIQALPTCGAYSLTSFGGLALTFPTSGGGTGAGCNAVQVSNGTSTDTLDLRTMTSVTAPGAAALRMAAVCGTGAGSMKIIAYAGTSATPVTVADNIGTGVTGC